MTGRHMTVRMTCGSTNANMEGSGYDTWLCDIDMEGHCACLLDCMGQSKGDMWHNHRVPHGTPDLANVDRVKNICSTSKGFKPLTSG
jgi:hypothetical protein